MPTKTIQSHTQPVVTGAGTLGTGGPDGVHACGTPYDIPSRAVVTHVQLVVPATGSCVGRESTADFICSGPHYLAVVARA
jgi:hypothetical protein